MTDEPLCRNRYALPVIGSGYVELSGKPAVDAEDYFLRLGAIKTKAQRGSFGSFPFGVGKLYILGSPAIVQWTKPLHAPHPFGWSDM